jgi:serine-type D-Ala-D-Ala carboxypeptidase (penicillin-binding protein 5/6)
MPILYAIIFALISINVLLGLPKAVNLTQTIVSAKNIPSNVPSENKENIAGVKKIIPLPKDNTIQIPSVSATAIIIKDLESGVLLYVKDPDKKVPIASTTKIMTALVASDYFKANDVLEAKDISLVSGSSMGLKSGEKLTFRSLLYGMLLNSGNDAAYTLADNYPGGRNDFIDAMNAKSSKIGLVNTHFDNPAGFDSDNHYSSAFDLAKIAEEAIANNQLARIVSTKETTVFSIDKESEHDLKNLNKLLDMPGVLGIKTGTTPAAKENLVGLIERDGHKILTVVLGSNDRFGETEKLINWSYSNFTWE